jgi:hypothetical protein
MRYMLWRAAQLSCRSRGDPGYRHGLQARSIADSAFAKGRAAGVSSTFHVVPWHQSDGHALCTGHSDKS